MCYLLGWQKTHKRDKLDWPQYLKLRERWVSLWPAHHGRTDHPLAVLKAPSWEWQDYRQSLQGQVTVFSFSSYLTLEKSPFQVLPRHMPQVNLSPKLEPQELLVYWSQKNVWRSMAGYRHTKRIQFHPALLPWHVFLSSTFVRKYSEARDLQWMEGTVLKTSLSDACWQ